MMKNKHHGINVPVFSLKSRKSGGIGEFLDLKLLIDLCKDVGFDVIQLLPLNDTGNDTSPYSAVSAFALNPLNLRLHSPELEILNNEERINYTKVKELKEKILRERFKKEFPSIQKSKAYNSFISTNFWIPGYSLFKSLKTEYKNENWESWPKEVQDFTEETYNALHITYSEEVHFHSFVQYLCYTELSEVKKYAEKQGVFLKGDIPILIGRDSADVWLHRNLFCMDYSAGAPPDQYSTEGQNWGFPIYNWEEAEKQGYSWWRERLKFASNLYHIYRIDHIVGFFRIWAIPLHKSAKEGSFIPAEEDTWIPHGEKILDFMIKVCPMLPIGEDLGTVPTEVRACLKRLGICGTKVMRWERDWEKAGIFIPIEKYPLESMTTVSTHDSETLQLWWTTHKQEAIAYAAFKAWKYSPTLKREYHIEILHDSHRSNSLFHINLLQEYLALFPELVNPDPAKERINLPATISEHNWSYRFRPYLEDILKHKELKAEMSGYLR